MLRTSSYYLLLFFIVGGGGLSGCAALSETGREIRDSNGVLMNSEEHYLGQRKFRITLRGSSILFDSEAEQAFHRRADAYTQSVGCNSWKLLEYRSGIENTLLGARRYVDAVVECLKN